MSKVEKELTGAEILEWATKDTVIGACADGVGLSPSSEVAGQMPYGINTSGCYASGTINSSTHQYQLILRNNIVLTRHTNDGNRKIGFITGVNSDGSFNIYLLGSGTFNSIASHFASTRTTMEISGNLRDLPPSMDYYFPEHASDFGTYYWDTQGRGVRGIGYDNNDNPIDVSQSFEYIPQWKETNQTNSVFRDCTYINDNRILPQTNIQLTNNPNTTLQIGKPIDCLFWQRSQAGWYYGDKNIGGDLFDLLSAMSLSVCTSVANMPSQIACSVSQSSGYAGSQDNFILNTYQPFNGMFAYHYTPYNLILTYDLDAAKNYVATGELPGDAFLYPFDVDNIPVNSDGGTGAEDSDATQDTVDTGDTTWEETDDQSPSAPGQNGQSLTNNNLYWLTSQQLKNFLDWFWDEATDVSDPSELFEKIQGLYENLSEAIVAVRYMPVRPEWIGGVSTDTKIIVGMLEKAEQCRVINKVVPDIQTIGSIDIRELAKDNKTWDGFLNYSPYCQMSLYLPFHGFIDLDADLIMNSKLTIKAAYDILTGTIQYFIYRTARGADNLNLVNTVVAKMATDIPISLQTKTQRDSAIFQNVSSAAGNLIGAGASLATGNPIGMVMSTANIAATQPTGAPLTLKGTISENGAYYDSALCAIYVKRPGINIPSNYDRKVGNPCNVAMKLSQVHGFVKCENPFISFSEVTSDNSLGFPPPKPTKDEIDTIYNALSEGVILP